MWFTTTAWMMWNALASSLLLRASIVMLDGNPIYPDLELQWRLAEQLRPDADGRQPRAVDGRAARRVSNLRDHDTLIDPPARASPARRSRPRGSTGSTSSSAPTCCSTSAAAAPTCAPGSSRAARCCRSTGARCRAASSPSTPRPTTRRAQPVIGQLGELVIRSPMPSMPVRFWNDPDGSALPRGLLRGLPRCLAPRGLDHVHRARQLRDHRPLRRDAQPRRRAARHGRVLPGRGGARRDRRQPRRASRGSRGRSGRADPVRRRSPRASSFDDALRARSRQSCGGRCPRGMSRTRSRRYRQSRERSLRRSSSCRSSGSCSAPRPPRLRAATRSRTRGRSKPSSPTPRAAKRPVGVVTAAAWSAAVPAPGSRVCTSMAQESRAAQGRRGTW